MENSEKGTPTEFGLKILQKLYPKIASRAAQIQPHQTLLEEEKFSQQEIDDIVKKIPIGKAPGYDGIDNIIVKVIFNSFPSLLLDFFNKCLELKCFPDPLKIGLVILFHKTGKEEQNIKTYRLISLLPTLGKLLEKLLLQRFNFQVKTNKLQHPLQYGFREGKSADDALLHVTSLLEQAQRQEKHAVLISLDISGAFDNQQYSSIRDRFASLSLFSNISETLLDTLRNRKVAMQTSEGPVLWEQTQGCPQGSCSGPAFWNIVTDEILSVQWPQGVHIQAFADDSSQKTPEKGSERSAN
ncbi:Retrovirus-related Pol polyprotein from type-1 retrotransposable element R1 [Araneus ventricosus]|uniref:Retrovirus-related Pol polyprotein from type-1 retrotransposable element R1 n=1 Tax=Araneus ventricosus TaxID=182803 RepID=A0A4Y2KY81_ARAVE|nr:Retrovirus-related Pol polyprotein from type-1 retrotransposable element R1 [Araneus ventricosus]